MAPSTAGTSPVAKARIGAFDDFLEHRRVHGDRLIPVERRGQAVRGHGGNAYHRRGSPRPRCPRTTARLVAVTSAKTASTLRSPLFETTAGDRAVQNDELSGGAQHREVDTTAELRALIEAQAALIEAQATKVGALVERVQQARGSDSGGRGIGVDNSYGSSSRRRRADPPPKPDDQRCRRRGRRGDRRWRTRGIDSVAAAAAAPVIGVSATDDGVYGETSANERPAFTASRPEATPTPSAYSQRASRATWALKAISTGPGPAVSVVGGSSTSP